MLALGIDIGSSTTKAVLVDVDGDRVREWRTESGPTPPTAEELVAQVRHRAHVVLGEDAGRVEAIGVASMAETGVPLDRDGQALTPLLRWDAGLGAADAEQLGDQAADLFAATGVRLGAKTPLATWAWLRRTDGEVWRRMTHWLGTADLVVHALTGQAVTDHTLAGRTGGYRLSGPGEPVPATFDGDLLAVVGLTPDRMPRVTSPTEVAGRLTTTAASALGLRAGLPVVVAGHDHQIAAWAAGARSPGAVADSLGTAEAVMTVLAQRPPLERVRAAGMSLVRTPTGAHDALIAGSSSAGAMLRHWLETVPPDRRDAVLEEAADATVGDPSPTGAAVLPYLRGRQTPEPDAGARAGDPPAGWPLHRQARAVVEGICYQARWMIAAQTSDAAPPQHVTVIGGDRLPRVWSEAKRRTLPWPVSTVRSAEPVAAGAALLALVRAGALGAVPHMLQRAPTLALQQLPQPDGDPHADSFADFVRRATS